LSIHNRIATVTAGWSSLVARRAHNPKVVGSNPAPATKFKLNRKTPDGVFWFLWQRFMKKVNAALEERLTKLITSMGYELFGCEQLPQGGMTLLRLYLDSPKGITIEDCSRVSRQVSALLDVEDPIQGRYTLEVSSPGIGRPLFTLEHFKRYLGKRVKIRLLVPINQRRQYKGLLSRVENEQIYLLVEEVEQEVALPFSAIEKANLIEDINL
jgi:ribosome maturation factor RimP